MCRGLKVHTSRLATCDPPHWVCYFFFNIFLSQILLLRAMVDDSIHSNITIGSMKVRSEGALLAVVSRFEERLPAWLVPPRGGHGTLPCFFFCRSHQVTSTMVLRLFYGSMALTIYLYNR